RPRHSRVEHQGGVIAIADHSITFSFRGRSGQLSSGPAALPLNSFRGSRRAEVFGRQTTTLKIHRAMLRGFGASYYIQQPRRNLMPSLTSVFGVVAALTLSWPAAAQDMKSSIAG